MARALGLKSVEAESANKQAILLCVSELVPPWEVDALVCDIRELARLGDLSLRWSDGQPIKLRMKWRLQLRGKFWPRSGFLLRRRLFVLS